MMILRGHGAGEDMIKRVADRKGATCGTRVDISKIADDLGYARRCPSRADWRRRSPGTRRTRIGGDR